jgi:hypothetical protein
MRHSSTSIATHWRRRFITGATAVIVAGTGTHAKADFRYRLGLSQPLDSPNYLRLQEMAEKVRLETNDRMLIEVHGAGRYRRGNKQTVEVRHVHIHPGGQGVVGIINPPEDRDGGGRE